MSIQLKKILISDPVDDAAVQILKERGLQVDVRTGLPKEQLVSIIPEFPQTLICVTGFESSRNTNQCMRIFANKNEYDALIVRSGTQVTKDVIEAGRSLKLIGRAGVGVDNIDLVAATKAGIVVINAPGGNTISAVELTCTMILTTARHVPQACAQLKNGVWDRKSYMGNELKGKTLAVIGLGRIGREVSTRMQSFGMTTIGFDPIVPVEAAKEFGVESLSLEEIWPRADFITVHTPLIPQTKNLLNAETLAKCKKGVRIINVARGGIVDESALLDALQSGHVAGAGLDVFLEEPPKNTQLVTHPRVVCTPHLGASTKEAQNNVAKEIALQFLDIVDGKSVPGVVNAPLLSEILKHENLIWTKLGEALGKLAATHSATAKSFQVTIKGAYASKAAKLIKESVLVGALTVRTKSKSVNVISAAGIAEGLGISANFTVETGSCCQSMVTVQTDSGVAYIGVPQGRRCYLAAVGEAKFEPPVALEGTLTVLETKPSVNHASVLAELASQGDLVSAISRARSGNLYAVHSTGSLNLTAIPISSITEIQF